MSVPVLADVTFMPFTGDSTPHGESFDAGTPEVYEVPPTPQLVDDGGLDGAERLLIVMVGLPARGKTFLAHKLSRLLSWGGIRCQVVNVQVAWRAELHTPQLTWASFEALLHDDTAERAAYRRVLQDKAVLSETFFANGGRCVVVNDDLVSASLRRDVVDAFHARVDRIMYVEVHRKGDVHFDRLKVLSPNEYPAAFTAPHVDFDKRVNVLTDRYEGVSEGNATTFVRLLGPGTLTVTNASGFLPSRAVQYMLNLSQQSRTAMPIYFTRHGQSRDNLVDRIGGDSSLTERGRSDADALANFIESVVRAADGVAVEMWTSLKRRTQETAAPAIERLQLGVRRLRALNEINGGVCEGLTYAEVQKEHPSIHALRLRNKFYFRYPHGESYQDLLTRLEAVIMDLENTDRIVVIVAHQAILRVLLSYFGNMPAAECTTLSVPHRTVWRCTYDSRGETQLTYTHLD